MTMKIKERTLVGTIVDTDALARAIAPLIAATVVDRLRIDALAGDDLILNTKEASRWLGRSPHTLDMWRKVGIGPEAIVFGRSVGYRLGALRDYTRSRPRHGRPVLQRTENRKVPEAPETKKGP